MKKAPPKCRISHCPLTAISYKDGALCHPHYQQAYRGKDPEAYRIPEDHPALARPACSVEGCELPRQSHGFCARHRRAAQEGSIQTDIPIKKLPVCEAPGCEKVSKWGKLCGLHQSRQARYGSFDLPGSSKIRCADPECDRVVKDRDHCFYHLRQFDRYGFTWSGPMPKDRIQQWKDENLGTCEVQGCESQVSAYHSSLCRTHKTEITARGCSLEFYNALISVTSCEACGAEGKLVVDHDHRCHPGGSMCEKCIRGRICGGCNAALGFAKDSQDRLRALIDYLDRWDARQE